MLSFYHDILSIEKDAGDREEIFTCWFVCEIDIPGRRELGWKYQVMSVAQSLYFSPCRINQVCNFDFIRLRMSGVISSLSELFQLNASKC